MDLTEGERRHRVGTKGYKNALLSAFIVALLLTSAALPILGWTSLTSASPTPNAKTKLEGFDKTAGKWATGNLDGWKELDWVPYRLKFSDLPEENSSYTFNIYHNNLLDDKEGVDRLRDFHVEDENGNPVTDSVTVSGPSYENLGKGSDRDIYYTLTVKFTTEEPGLTWCLYWQAHLAFGASGWPGSSLHAYTDIGGKKSVPINVPPTPVGSISGYKWHDENDDGSWSHDENPLSGWTIQLSRFEENAWRYIAEEKTDSYGSYAFVLVEGSYRLYEVLKDNWTQTFPSSGNHEVELSEGETRGNINFGNYFLAEVEHGVEVSISPSENSGIPSTTLNYTVTVTNAGNVSDNYDISVSDNAVPSWAPSLSDNLLVNVQPGENRVVTLSVTIPENAKHRAEDNIIVTATSQENTDVSDFDTCIAHVTEAVAPSAPTLKSPENGMITNDNMPTFEWTIGANANNHRLLVYNDPDFTSPKENVLLGATDTTYTISAGLADENYSWKVLAINAFGENESSTRTFLIDTIAPPTPTLGSPENNAVENTLIQTFTWTEPEAGVGYHIQIDNEISFDSYYYVHENSGLTDNSYIYTFASGGVYYWRVRAVDAATNQSSWSDKFKLTIQAPPGQPTPNLPTDGAITNDNTPTFEWTVGANADNHRLLVDNDSDFTSPIENRLFGSTDNTYTLENSLPDDNYSWKMIAINVLGENQSPVWTFVIDTVPPDAPGWGSPDGTTDDNTPTFDWPDVPDAENYDFLIDGIQVTISVSTYTLTVELPDGTYSWKVRARDAAGNVGDWSSTWTLIIKTIVREVEVSISPGSKSGGPGETLSYTVNVKNEGNISDTYALTVADSAGWGPTLSKDSLEVDPQSYETVALTVTIPSGASLGTQDTITITAKSTQDPTVSDSASCTAKAMVQMGVEVSISPDSKSGAPEETLTYDVTVKNTGSIDDTYTLSAVGAEGWSISIEPTSLILAADATGEATLSVVVPPDASENDSMTVTVSATSTAYPSVTDSDTCETIAKGVPVEPEVNLALLLAILALLILLLILLLAYLLRRRSRGVARRRVLRDVCLGLGAALLAMIYLLAGRRRAARRSVFKDASPAPKRWIGDRDC